MIHGDPHSARMSSLLYEARAIPSLDEVAAVGRGAAHDPNGPVCADADVLRATGPVNPASGARACGGSRVDRTVERDDPWYAVWVDRYSDAAGCARLVDPSAARPLLDEPIIGDDMRVLADRPNGVAPRSDVGALTRDRAERIVQSADGDAVVLVQRSILNTWTDERVHHRRRTIGMHDSERMPQFVQCNGFEVERVRGGRVCDRPQVCSVEPQRSSLRIFRFSDAITANGIRDVHERGQDVRSTRKRVPRHRDTGRVLPRVHCIRERSLGSLACASPLRRSAPVTAARRARSKRGGLPLDCVLEAPASGR